MPPRPDAIASDDADRRLTWNTQTRLSRKDMATTGREFASPDLVAGNNAVMLRLVGDHPRSPTV